MCLVLVGDVHSAASLTSFVGQQPDVFQIVFAEYEGDVTKFFESRTLKAHHACSATEWPV